MLELHGMNATMLYVCCLCADNEDARFCCTDVFCADVLCSKLLCSVSADHDLEVKMRKVYSWLDQGYRCGL
jgi:hypothetical protein